MSLSAPLPQRAPAPDRSPAMPGEWLTVTELALLWRLHPNTVYRHLNNGTLPCETKRIGRCWRIKAEDAEDALDALSYLIAGGTVGPVEP